MAIRYAETGRPHAEHTRLACVLGIVLAVGLAAVLVAPPLAELAAVRAVLGTVAVFVAPGYLALLAADIRCRRRSKQLLYAAGTSLAFVVVLGLAGTTLLPRLGVERPLVVTTWALVASLAVLSALAWYRTAKRASPTTSNGSGIAGSRFVPADTTEHRRSSATATRSPRSATATRSPRSATATRSRLSIALLALLPALAFLTGTGVSVGETVVPQLLLIASLATTVVLLGTGIVPREHQPFAVWCVSLAVLLEMTLVSSHLWGWDVHFQYYVARRILLDGTYAIGLSSTPASLLPVTVGAATTAAVTGLDLVWVYKLCFPLVVALLPVAIYHVAARQFDDDRVAVLAPFGLVFYYGYFKIFPAKQFVAQVFFVLVVLVLFDDAVDGPRKRALGVVFAAMLVVSHYGISLLLVAVLGAAVVVAASLHALDVLPSVDDDVVRPTLVSSVGVGWLLWYLTSAAGTNFRRVVLLAGESLPSSGGSGGSSRTAIAYLVKSFASPLWTVYKALNVLLVGFVALGVAWTAYAALIDRDGDGDGDGNGDAPDVEFAAIGVVTLAFLASSVRITYGMGFDRTLLFALSVLAPFAFVGFRTVARVPGRLPIAHLWPSRRGIAGAFAAFLAVLFLFSSGGAFALAGHQVPSYSINLDDDTGWPVYNRTEVDASRWLVRNADADERVAVYNDWTNIKSRDALLLKEVFPRDRIERIWLSRSDLSNATYVYVSDKPMVRSTEGNDRPFVDPRATPAYDVLASSATLVYQNDDVRIYRLRHSQQSPSNQTAHQRPNAQANATVEGQ
ncbi:MAG: DUF2206 domain-containing protein [Haloarculaceae archaeon]